MALRPQLMSIMVIWMKKIFTAAILLVFLLSGCSAMVPMANDSSSSAVTSFVGSVHKTSSQARPVDQYLFEHKEYVEPEYEEELENKHAVFDAERLYRVLSDGTKEELLPYPATRWAILSEHTLLVVQSNALLKVDTEKWQVDTIYEHERPITSLNTNGTLVFFTTDTQIYRYFIPTGDVDLIATDEMLISIFSPISTTEILWTAYNPLWLKKYYEANGVADNVYNVFPTLFVFHNTQTDKSYRWIQQNVMEDVLKEGLEWYRRQSV